MVDVYEFMQDESYGWEELRDNTSYDDFSYNEE